MDYLAAIIELIAKWLVGDKKRIGYIIHILSAVVWVYVCITQEIYGLLLVLVPSTIINVINFRKWHNERSPHP